MAALQALANKCLRHPEHEQCERCIEEENEWIARSKEPYPTGFRACADCPKTHKLLIPAFPGSGKSDTLCEWAAWMIGREAFMAESTPQMGLICYSDSVAATRSVAIRDTIQFSDEYKHVFPTVLPDKAKGWGQSEWFVWRQDPQKKDPTFIAAGFHGTILSNRFPTGIIIDDPHNPDNVYGGVERDEVWRIYRQAIRTRGAGSATPIVLVMNRWAEDDLAGRVMQVEKDWMVLRTPARDEMGVSVWPPEVVNGIPCGISTETLERYEAEDRKSFITQYMVQPFSEEGGIFRYVHRRKLPAMQEVKKIIQFWDTASTKKTWSDYSAMCEFWMLGNGQAYLANVVNEKMTPGELTDRMYSEYAKACEIHRNVRVYVESLQAGSVFAEYLYSKSGLRIENHDPGGFGKGGIKRGPKDLHSRAASIVKHVEAGSVLLPWTEPWLPWAEDFESQLMGYPDAQNDDMVAAFVGGIEVLFPHAFTQMPRIEFSMKGW